MQRGQRRDKVLLSQVGGGKGEWHWRINQVEIVGGRGGIRCMWIFY